MFYENPYKLSNRTTNLSYVVTLRGRIANDVPRDALHGIYQNVLHSQNVVIFHGTRPNVILLTPMRKVRPFLHRLSQNSQTFSSIICRYLVPRVTLSGNIWGYAVSQLVEAMRYRSEGRGFDSRWCHWKFSLTLSFHLYSWGVKAAGA
jgi:hypothetical protein